MLALNSTGYGFEVERGPEWLLIRVRGDDGDAGLAEAPSDLDEQVWELAGRHFTYRVVLELDLVQHVEDKVIGQLTRLNHRFLEHDGVLRICGLSAENRDALAQLGHAELCLAYDTWEEAVLGCHGPQIPR